MERLCILSFLSNGHTFHLYSYEEIENLPKGTILKDASDIIPPDKIFKYREQDSYAGFSNVFRYKLLLESGQYWVDTDVICLSPIDIESDYVFPSSVNFNRSRYWKTRSEVESCVIKVPPGSAIMEYCFLESLKEKPIDLKWGQIGPDLLDAGVEKYNLQEYVASPYKFCPISYENWDRVLNGSFFVTWVEIAKMSAFKTKTIHLWNEMWRKNEIDKNSQFPEWCLYEWLKRRYLPILAFLLYFCA